MMSVVGMAVMLVMVMVFAQQERANYVHTKSYDRNCNGFVKADRDGRKNTLN